MAMRAMGETWMEVRQIVQSEHMLEYIIVNAIEWEHCITHIDCCSYVIENMLGLS